MFTPITKVTTWEDLQDKVKDFFNELGYKSSTNEPIALANQSTAKVDVYAVKGDSPLAQKILFECKFWNSDVPRSIVQSFKMDVQEAGANFGIIVSKVGFQSGAYQGVTLTTVKLYTFEELQKAFAEEWAQNNLVPVSMLYNQVVDIYRVFQFGTPEREHYEWSLFNDRLKALHHNLEASVSFPLALYKDNFSKDALANISNVTETFPQPYPDGRPRIAKFNDARSMSKTLKSLFEYAITTWHDYQSVFSEEVMKLSDIDRSQLFNTIR